MKINELIEEVLSCETQFDIEKIKKLSLKISEAVDVFNFQDLECGISNVKKEDKCDSCKIKKQLDSVYRYCSSKKVEPKNLYNPAEDLFHCITNNF